MGKMWYKFVNEIQAFPTQQIQLHSYQAHLMSYCITNIQQSIHISEFG